MSRQVVQWMLVATLAGNAYAVRAAVSLADIEWQRVFDTVIDRD